MRHRIHLDHSPAYVEDGSALRTGAPRNSIEARFVSVRKLSGTFRHIQGNGGRSALHKERAWEIVAPLLELTEAERDYTERIQAGDFAPEILFPDVPEILNRIYRNPALLWKAENARRHARKLQ